MLIATLLLVSVSCLRLPPGIWAARGLLIVLFSFLTAPVAAKEIADPPRALPRTPTGRPPLTGPGPWTGAANPHR